MAAVCYPPRKGKTTQMSCLRRICGDRSWDQNAHFADLRSQCHVPSIQNRITYHRLWGLGKVSRMTGDRLGHCLEGLVVEPLGVAHPKLGQSICVTIRAANWNCMGCFGTYMNWWLECKDKNVWTKPTHKVVVIHT
jgi:hypothetical protein